MPAGYRYPFDVPFDEQEVMVRDAWTKSESDGLAFAVSPAKPKRGVAPARAEASSRLAGSRPRNARLAHTVLSHLPIGVAVIDRDTRLLFWNEEAARLFGIPPLMAAEMPPLTEILTGIVNLSARQRDTVLAFVATHIAAGRRAEPNSCLRLALARDRRIAIHIREIGASQWLLVIDDGTMSPVVDPNERMTVGAVAWLDALTGLANRRHLNQKLRELLEEEPAAAARHALLMIDLDGFKAINDVLGHPIGDALLCLVAQRLRRETRDDDQLARLGGDEFVILIAEGEQAERVAGRVVEILSRPYLVEGHVANIGASIGIVRFAENAASGDDLMRFAELALHEAKRAGRRTWRLFAPAMATDAQARRDMETELRKALIMGELSLAYQPQLNVPSQTLTGFEALLRWHSPMLGNVPPSSFIPVAEEIGVIVALGEWVLKTACEEAARWPAPLTVAVNVSPFQFKDAERLFDAVQAALQASGLAADRLELEITESSLLLPDAPVLDTLHRLRASGIQIALDDFGTGYSSLGQLRLFPFNKIKIDRSFIAGLGVKGDAAAVIRAIVALGAELGMSTIAEGVETDQQAMAIKIDGCTDIQGFLVSRPMPPAEIDKFLSGYPTVQDKIPTKIR